MIEEAGGRSENARDAVIGLADLVITALELVRAGIVDEAAHKQIQAAIIVVVKPNRAGRPSGSGHASLSGYIGKSRIMVILVENAVAVCSHKDVWPAVVVVVSDCNSHS